MALWKLNPLDFTKMNPKRQAIIEAAPAKPLPPTDSYVPNQIAKALHPGVQHLKVVKIEKETATANRYYLAPNPGKGTEALAWFSAGQYLSVTLKIGNMILTRPYSLASSPRERYQTRFHPPLCLHHTWPSPTRSVDPQNCSQIHLFSPFLSLPT